MGSLDRIILAALLEGEFEFTCRLQNPRYCQIGDLRLVRPVVDERWHLVVGRKHDHARLGLAVHLALEWCRIGYQRRMASEKEARDD